MVTLTMVPDRFECRATAHSTAFKRRKKFSLGERQFWPIAHAAKSDPRVTEIHLKKRRNVGPFILLLLMKVETTLP